MAAKWRILLKAIECSDATADLIVKAICILHNFIIDERSLNLTTLAGSGDDDNGLWRQEVLQTLESIEMKRRYANAAGYYALENKRKLIHFFNGIGMVP
uniref:DDE Tnp4 domain-containing protein n=1 Tax=Acrobeloides nanus TaxID=290746 RepID=A0A914D5C3_9BILA